MEGIKRVLIYSLFFGLFTLIGDTSSYGKDNCVSQGCHDGLLKAKFIHGPVRGRNCQRCHGGNDHPFPLIKKKEEICGICHKSITSKKNVHQPVSENCMNCHNPHSSEHENLLIKSRVSLCFNCHDEKDFKNVIIHPPVSENCMSCHRPHDSDYKKLLLDAPDKLCYNCHDPKNTKKHVHPPVKEGDCTGCHNPHSSRAKALTKDDGNNLCYICHDKKNYVGKKVVHKPVSESCKNCHQPHESDTGKLLNEDNICITCHGDMIKNAKVVHPPVADKDCMACHVPHTSDANKLIINKMPEVCFNCHDKGIFTKKYVHPPVAENCAMCHQPHSSGHNKLLIAKNEYLCRECHGDLINIFKKYKFPHPPVKDEQCDACHVVHSSDTKKILKNLPVFLCAECHDIGDAKTARSIHKPVDDGNCGDCHGVHGGNENKLLISKYPVENYPPYNAQTYGLCFMCHNSDLARDPKTLTATNFRNGDKNLHYVHVNKDKSRNCRFCHDPHMSTQEKLIKRDYRSFGAWNIPINFSKTITGGGCIVGCHKPFYYDRAKPIKNN